MSFNKLYYNNITLNDTTSNVDCAPHFICPKCKFEWEPKQMFTKPPSKLIDLNQQTLFQCPKCRFSITLYVAIHCESNVKGSVCIAVEPIPSGWWQKT
jgi:hypothetical protein